MTSFTTGVNLDITRLANPPPVAVPPQVSEQVVYVPENNDAEILGHEKAIRHCQGHVNRDITDLKTSKEKVQHFEKMHADLRERLARASCGSRGSHRERCELQDALDEQEVIIRHHHQDAQTSKESLTWAKRELQEKRELIQQFKRRRLGDNSTP